MSKEEKGAILNQVHNLSPLQKARALGFMQGLAAANADGNEQENAGKDAEEKKEEGAVDG